MRLNKIESYYYCYDCKVSVKKKYRSSEIIADIILFSTLFCCFIYSVFFSEYLSIIWFFVFFGVESERTKYRKQMFICPKCKKPLKKIKGNSL